MGKAARKGRPIWPAALGWQVRLNLIGDLQQLYWLYVLSCVG